MCIFDLIGFLLKKKVSKMERGKLRITYITISLAEQGIGAIAKVKPYKNRKLTESQSPMS